MVWGWLSILTGLPGFILFILAGYGPWPLWGLLGISPLCAALGLREYRSAKSAARAQPEVFTPPRAGSWVLNLLGPTLEVISIVALGFPAVWVNLSAGRDHYVTERMQEGLQGLSGQYLELRRSQVPLNEIPRRLKPDLDAAHGFDRNPWNRSIPVFDMSITVVKGLDAEGVLKAAESRARVVGQAVFVIELPAGEQAGQLAGAVLRRAPSYSHAQLQSKVVQLDRAVLTGMDARP